MKIKNLALLFFGLLLLSCGSTNVNNSNTINPDILRSVVWSKNYTVYVNQIKLSQSNILKNNNSVRTFDDPKAQYIRITPSYLEVYLPYIGDAQIGGSNPTVEFKSVKYEYLTTEKPDGHWQIEIKPESGQNVKEISIDVNREGTAFVSVNFSDRAPANYNGFIEN